MLTISSHKAANRLDGVTAPGGRPRSGNLVRVCVAAVVMDADEELGRRANAISARICIARIVRTHGPHVVKHRIGIAFAFRASGD